MPHRLFGFISVILFFILIPLGSDAHNQLDFSRYSGKLQVDTTKRVLKGLVRLECRHNGDSDTILLNVSPKINRVEISGQCVVKYSIDRFPEKSIVRVICKPGTKNVSLDLEYELDFGAWYSGLTLIDEEILPTLDIGTRVDLFTYNLEIITSGFVYSAGNLDKKNDAVTVSSHLPVDRIFLIFSNSPVDIHQVKVSKDLTLKLVSVDSGTNETLILKIAKEVISFYNELACDRKINDLTIVSNNHLGYSFFCRSGLISLHSIENEKTASYLISHEISHYWWCNALVRNQVPEAFLNESFAQFYSYLFYRKLFGEEKYRELLAKKKQQTEDIKINISRLSNQLDGSVKERLLYIKGALLLCALADQAGQPAFNDFLCEVQKKRVTSIKQLEAIILRTLGPKNHEFFLKRFI